MPDPTRQEIIDAHEVVKDYIDHKLDVAHNEADIKEALRRDELLLKFLPPLPRLTMADIEWDDEKHYLAEATSDQFGRVIMLRKGKEGYIEFIVPGEPECGTLVAYTEYLTPTGRRYTLKEIDND